MSRFVDRGAIAAGWVGVGMAMTIAVSFLLVVPIEPVFWVMSPFAGLIIGYYANSRAGRTGPWGRILLNGIYSGLLDSRFSPISISRANHEATIFTDNLAKFNPYFRADDSKTSALEIGQSASLAREIALT